MKKIVSISFMLAGLMALTSCYKETEYDWVDKTDHVFDYWSASRVNIFYVNSDEDGLFNLSDATKCPVVSDKKLSDAEVDSIRKTLTLSWGQTYTVSSSLSGYYVSNTDGAIIGFLYQDSSYNNWPCLIPYMHVNNAGTTTSYIYTVDSEGKVAVDTLVGTYHYAQEDDHWLFEATKMTLNSKDIWSEGGNEVGVVIQK